MQIAAGAAGRIYQPSQDRPRTLLLSLTNQTEPAGTDGVGLEVLREIKEVQAFPGEMSATVNSSSLASALWAVRVRQSEKERGAIA